MRFRFVRLAPAILVAGLLTVAPAARTVAPAHALQFSDLNTIQRRILSGFASTELGPQAAGAATARAAATAQAQSSDQASSGGNYFPSGTGTCPGNFGEHFSNRVLVSRDSDLCPNTFGVATPLGRCNENQFSQPFTGPDGALYVTWANFNNSTEPRGGDDDGGGGGGDGAAINAVAEEDNAAQMLLARSTDGGQTFGAPVKVADYYDVPEPGTAPAVCTRSAFNAAVANDQEIYTAAASVPTG